MRSLFLIHRLQSGSRRYVCNDFIRAAIVNRRRMQDVIKPRDAFGYHAHGRQPQAVSHIDLIRLTPIPPTDGSHAMLNQVVNAQRIQQVKAYCLYPFKIPVRASRVNEVKKPMTASLPIISESEARYSLMG